MKHPLAQRYAQALYEICKENAEIEGVYADMTMLAEALGVSDELKDFVTNRALPRSRQEAALQALFSKKISDTALLFLFFLVNKSRLHFLPQICERFEAMVLDSQNIIKATIISSMALEARQVDAVKKHLGSLLHKEIRETLLVDPALIGGVKVRVGDEIYDYTVRAQLDEFRFQFNKAA